MSNEKYRGDAFEYALGTLRGKERSDFADQLRSSPTLKTQVCFWEEQLMAYYETEKETHSEVDDPQTKLIPAEAGTWEAIETQLNKAPVENKKQLLSKWLFALAPAFCLCLALLLTFSPGGSTPNTDYIAVLTNEDGHAQLTALTTEHAKNTATMWLQWQGEALKPGTSAQLWAVSKRDGEIRPLAVFDQKNTAQLQLDEAKWRLVTDAESLILTEEEIGGSAIDEPSDIILAKGVCIRFDKEKHAS